MVQSSLWQRYGLTIERITGQFQLAITQQELFWVIGPEKQDDPLGFARVLPRGAFGQKAYLKQIGVHPAYSGKGLGTKLLQHIERECCAHSDQLFLLVSDFNTSAQRFYRQHGYEQIGSIPAFVLPDVAELIFYKCLDK